MDISKENPRVCGAGASNSSAILGYAASGSNISKRTFDQDIARKRRGLIRLPSIERLQQVFRFEAHTGLLKAAIARGGLLKGAQCGTVHVSGRIQVFVDGVAYSAGRIIWKLHRGVDPQGIIVHINGDPADNRISNLSEVL